MHIQIAPSRAKLLSSRGTTLELYCLASTDIRLSSAREPSRAITLRQSPARSSRVSRERLASFVTFLVSGTVLTKLSICATSMPCRKVEPESRVIWGTGGAVVLRTLGMRGSILSSLGYL